MNIDRAFLVVLEEDRFGHLETGNICTDCLDRKWQDGYLGIIGVALPGAICFHCFREQPDYEIVRSNMTKSIIHLPKEFRRKFVRWIAEIMKRKEVKK